MADVDESRVCARVPCARGSRLSFSWGVGNELRLIELRPPATGGPEQQQRRADDDEDDDAEDPFQSSVLWSTATPAHRAVATAVLPLSAQVAQLHETDPQALSGSAQGARLMGEYCTRFRAELLKQSVAAPAPNTLALEAAVWGLLEVLYVTVPSRDGGYLGQDLTAWYAEHGPTLDDMCGLGPNLPEQLTQLLATARPDTSPQYWPLMQRLVCVGRVGDALRLLDAHEVLRHAGGSSAHVPLPPAAQQQLELVDALYLLLRQMPHPRRAYQAVAPPSGVVGGPPGGTASAALGDEGGRQFDNMAEFLTHRSTWQGQCAGLPSQAAQLFADVAQHSPSTANGVQGVLSILAGDEAAVTAPCRTWLELAVAQLVHLRPQLQLRAHGTSLLRACLAARPLPDAQEGEEGGGEAGREAQAQLAVLGLVLGVLQCACEGEVQEVVDVLTGSSAVSPLVLAHAYDLMRSALSAASWGPGGRAAVAPLLQPLPLFGGSQVEYFRLILAEGLMPSSWSGPDSAAWRLALAYLAQCPVQGRAAAETLLDALPVSARVGPGLRLLRKACAQATALGLPAQATSLCRAAAAHAWYQGALAAAVAALGGGTAAGGALAPGSGGEGVAGVLAGAGGVVLEPLEQALVGELSTCSHDFRYLAVSLPELLEGELELLGGTPGSTSSTTSTLPVASSGSGWLARYLDVRSAMQRLRAALPSPATAAAADGPQPMLTANGGANGAARGGGDNDDDEEEREEKEALRRSQEQLDAARAFVQALVRLLGGGGGGEGAADGGPAAVGGSGVPDALLLPLLSRTVAALEVPAVAASVGPGQLAVISGAAARARQQAGAGAGRALADVQLCVARLACRAQVLHP